MSVDPAVEAGYGALQVWNREAMLGAPLALKLWLAAMALTFLASLLFVRSRRSPRVVLAGFALGLILSKLVFPAMGVVVYAGLVSLLHLGCWTPGYVLLLRERRVRAPATPAYRTWSWVLIVVVSISFVFDVRDGIRFLTNMLQATP